MRRIEHEEVERWSRWSGWMQHHVQAVRAHWLALGSPEPFRVLDVGCGPGGLLEELAHWAHGEGIDLELHGVDVDNAAVVMARRRLGDRALLEQAEAHDLGYPAKAFHLTTCSLVLHDLSGFDRVKLVSELHRVSRSVYLFDIEKTRLGALGARVLPRLVGLSSELARHGIERASTFAEFSRLVETLPVKPVRVFPGAMATWPDELTRVPYEVPDLEALAARAVGTEPTPLPLPRRGSARVTFPRRAAG